MNLINQYSKTHYYKKLTLLITCILFGIHIIAQQKCKDAVHPTENRKSILNCCIKEIKPGNIVVYKLGDTLYEIEAVAVNYQGNYFDLTNNSEIINVVYKDNYPGILYEGHNYAYYDQLYKKANGQMVTGITLATVGVGALFGGAVHMRNYEQEHLFDADEVGMAITLLGLAGIGVGIPIAIVGGAKKPKYKQAMLEIERKAKLSLSTTNHGAGLVLNF
jgi:hypothetical protein